MLNIEMNIELQHIWKEKFTKSNWGSINYIVGPNGTGKTILSEQIKNNLITNGFKPRILNAERLTGFERTDYSYYNNSQIVNGLSIANFENLKLYGNTFGLSSSAFIVLKERLDVRIKIEAFLSEIFKKTIRLIEEGGFLKPKIQNNGNGLEYFIKESECHGLKELITLMTFLYSEDNDVLILDEPELHLHPQFQSYFINEIRKIAGNPKEDNSKKVFFIVTHSPFFLDIRTTEELTNILVCNHDSYPRYIDVLDENDEYVLKRFLPRFNTYHKQFFFSPNPVFVEGYTDQQIITLLYDRLGLNIGSAGSCIIDVGGKDELSVFFRLCKKLNINCRIIADFDALFKGKLRQVIQNDELVKSKFTSEGLGANFSNALGEIERKLNELSLYITKFKGTAPELVHLKEYLVKLKEDQYSEKALTVLMALCRYNEIFCDIFEKEKADDIKYIMARYNKLLSVVKEAGIFIIPDGELEHSYKHTTINYLEYGKKDELFHNEREYILSLNNSEDVKEQYRTLLPLLYESIPIIEVDTVKHLQIQIMEWIYGIQLAIRKGDIKDISSLKSNSRVNYSLFSQILTLDDDKFILNTDGSFICEFTLNKNIIDAEKVISFNEKTVAFDFNIN